MESEKILERYLLSHPDYWDFEDEVIEVERLKLLVQRERILAKLRALKSNRTEALIFH